MKLFGFIFTLFLSLMVAFTNAQTPYTVQPGDTLFAIAQQRCGSAQRVGEIQSLNNLATPDIFPGDTLMLPPGCM
jgi:LysM repeat protein